MDIVSRIKKFLDHAGISNSQFADTCDIPRPTLSQLLNGRNKKVSNEVIDKIHTAYPSLNILWLMFGDGEMCNPGSGIPSGADEADPSTSAADEVGQRAISFENEQPIGYGKSGKASQPRMSQPSMDTIQTIIRNSGMGRTVPRGNASPDARRVESIFVFYSDGRFEQFGPLK